MIDKEKSSSSIPTEIKSIVIIVIGVAIFWFGLRFIFGVNNPFYVVASGSMVPNLNVNDLLIVRGSSIIPFNDLKVGDIMIFNRPDGGDRVIVHRVVSIIEKAISPTEYERIIQTKGDANPSSILGLDYPIREHNYIGKVVYVIPNVGSVLAIISPPVNYVIIAITIFFLFFYLKKSREKNRP
jgi:signal peptidase I